MNHSSERGVSPVIGIVLMVIVVVGIVGLVAYISFDIVGDDQNPNSADASVDLSETTNGLVATVIRNENVDEFKIKGPNSKVISVLKNPGDTSRIVGSEGQYSVVAQFKNGDQQVLRTRTVEDADFSGLFVVNQNQDTKEVEARLNRKFDTDDRYDLVLNADNETSDSRRTVSDTLSLDTGSLVQQEIPDRVNPAADQSQIPLVDIGVNAEEQGTTVSVGETIKVHELANLCAGDQLLLVGENGDNVLSAEEININVGCDGLRTVSQYDGITLNGAKLINLGRQERDYFVFQFNNENQLPIRPAPRGDVDVIVEVRNSETNSLIDGSKVVLGNRTGTTGSDGEVLFEDIADGATLNAEASADGYYTGYKRGTTIDQNEGTNRITINLNERTGFNSVSKRTSGTIDPGDSVTYESSGGTLKVGGRNNFVPNISGGSVNLDTNGDNSNPDTSGGAFLLQRNSVVSGSEASNYIYGGDNVKTTKTFGSQSPVRSANVTEEDESSLLGSTQPEREFSVLNVDNRAIPNDRVFQIRTTIENTGDQEETDTLKVFAESTETDETINLVESDIILPPDKEVVNVQDLSFNGEVTGEYTVFVTLDSVEQVKEAGTLELFSSDRKDATFDPNSVDITPENPTIQTDQTTSRTLQSSTEDIEITIDGDGITGASRATVELFENGRRVASKEIGSGESISYSRNFNQPKYVQYHIGILESQEVALVDTIAVREESQISLAENNINIDITNRADVCNDVSAISNQFNCEVEIGNEIKLDATSSVFGTGNGEYLEEGDTVNGKTVESVEYRWLLDDEKIVDSPNQQTVTFSENGLYYVEMRATAVIGGQRISSSDKLLINSYQNPNKATSRVANTRTVGEFISVNLQSDRRSITEDVTLGFKSSEGSSVVDSFDVSVPPSDQGVDRSILLDATDYDSDIDIGESTTVLLQIRGNGEVIESRNIEIERQKTIDDTFSDPSSQQGFLDINDLSGSGTPQDPYVVTNDQELDVVRERLDSHYVLGNNIDASRTDQWDEGEGFEPIGKAGGDANFRGTFDGNGYVIKGLTINRPDYFGDEVGLFGRTSATSEIKNVDLVNVDINADNIGPVGGLVGLNKGTVQNSFVSGSISGEYSVNGVVGSNYGDYAYTGNLSSDVDVIVTG